MRLVMERIGSGPIEQVNGPKNIIIVSDYARISGGAAKVALLSSIGLARCGFNVHLFSAIGPVMPELADSRIHVHCLNEYSALDDPSRFRAARKGLWNTRAKNALARLLSKFSPTDTIVHFHQWTKALSPSIFVPVLDGGFRFVITLHDYFITCPNGGFLVYPREELCHRTPLSVSCIVCNCDQRDYSQKLWRVVRQIIQNCVLPAARRGHVIYVSEFSRAILAKHLPATLNWHFVPNPIEVEQLPRVDVTKNVPYVFVGRLSKEKGGGIFAEAAKRAGVKVAFVGEGEQFDEIRRINPQAEMAGWIRPSEVFGWIARARALIFPSIWYEMQGISVMEAAACGVPSIVSNPSAATDFVSDGATGLYAERANVEDLAHKLTMMQDDVMLERLSAGAYEDFWRAPPLMDRHLYYLERTYRSIFADAAA